MKKQNILLVDDDPTILGLIAFALEDRGYRVTTASGGEAAIDALRKKRFDLVITDLNMPGTDGIGVVKKAKDLHRDCGVMMLTGSSDRTLVAKALRVGADDYMLKPCRLPELWKRVDNCLERSEDRRISTRKKTVCLGSIGCKGVLPWPRILESPLAGKGTGWTSSS
jgi:DNA-binding response OmpR family regulator